MKGFSGAKQRRLGSGVGVCVFDFVAASLPMAGNCVDRGGFACLLGYCFVCLYDEG